MKAYQEQFPRAAMCEVLEISRSGYYKGRGERVNEVYYGILREEWEE